MFRPSLGDLECADEDKEWSHIWSKARRSPEQGNRRLKADKPATTIRAEHHGNVQWHYKLDRRISLREAARLQSFPDDFDFVCAMRATERQIGNAVPPVLAHCRGRPRSHSAVPSTLTYHGVFCPQARDLFSASSVTLRSDKQRGGNYLLRALQDIEYRMTDAAQRLDDALFIEYWGESCDPDERIERWLALADDYARDTGWKPSDGLFGYRDASANF